MKHEEVLEFWFEETTPEQHYKKDPLFDEKIKERFLSIYWEVMEGKTKTWRETPRGRLAEIIVLDQFSRNMFRDDAQAFAGDELALSLAEEAVASGDDMKLKENERAFLYMPYMHSESKEVHEKAMQLFEKLGNKNNLEYEVKHKAVIDEFGRYPHRNEVLGRESTPEEIKWLEAGGGF